MYLFGKGPPGLSVKGDKGGKGEPGDKGQKGMKGDIGKRPVQYCCCMYVIMYMDGWICVFCVSCMYALI